MQVELRAGETVAGKYRIERLLGRGAVGTVYRAEHVETGKRVALKCVDSSYALDPASTDRLVREAQAAARVRHTNVVDVYDVVRDGKLIFLVMEYLEGEPLSAFIARDDFAPHQLIALLLPAMRGVAEAHRQGVVHRDIKPDNIFLARQVDVGQPIAKVLDFGISKLDARGLPLRVLTADGYAIGTPGYMAYEQAMGDKTIDGRADVYAFGAILYEAFTGDVPHAASDFPALLAHFLTQPVKSPLSLGVRIPEALNGIIMWALERDRDQRVSSMEALIRELEPFALESSYVAEQKVSPHGLKKTLVGPWGMDKRALVPMTKQTKQMRSIETAPTEKAKVSSTGDAVRSFQQKRSRRARTILLGSAMLVLVIGLSVFALQQSEQAPEHSVSALRVEPADPASEPTAPELPRGTAPPTAAAAEAQAPTEAPSPAPELPRTAAQQQTTTAQQQTTAAQQLTTAAQPHTAAAQPQTTAAQSQTTAAQPHATAAQPHTASTQPQTTAAQPQPAAAQPPPEAQLKADAKHPMPEAAKPLQPKTGMPKLSDSSGIQPNPTSAPKPPQAPKAAQPAKPKPPAKPKDFGIY